MQLFRLVEIVLQIRGVRKNELFLGFAWVDCVDIRDLELEAKMPVSYISHPLFDAKPDYICATAQ